jgi:uncharacterized repeat protein (TIGR02543 family)
MTIKRFLESGGTLRAALFALALAALIGCPNPDGGDTTPSLVGISVDAAKTVYVQGDDLDPDALRITGTYSDGTTKDIPPGSAVIAGHNKDQVGTQTVTVTAEGKSTAFKVTVVSGDVEKAKQAVDIAVEEALGGIEEIVLSSNGTDVPQGVKWITPAQKAILDKAVGDARAQAASGNAAVEKIVAALEALQEAAKETAAAAEGHTGTKTEWSYTVTFNNNGGAGTDPQTKTITNPATTVDSLPTEPARSGAYIFSGWNTRNDGLGTPFTGTTPVAANITVYARWTAIVDAQAPRINAQPRSAAYTAGDVAAALSVTAVSRDGGELSYRWHSRAGSDDEWTAIEGATESSYTPPTATGGAFSYYVEIVNTNNDVNGTKTASVNSATATVTVTVINAQAPVISVQPQDGTYTVGQTATALSVTAASRDGGELSFQWHSRAGSGGEWAPINAATASSYTPSTATAGIVSYYVQVTNTNAALSGNKTAATDSREAMVTVNVVNALPPAISVQPLGATYVRNDPPTALSVTAASPDGGELSYQWHSRSGSNAAEPIPGATGASYTPPTAEYGTVYYRVKVTNTNNDVSGAKTAVTDSGEAAVTVTHPSAQRPVISAQPQDAAYNLGDTPTALSVTATSPDGGELSFRWYSRVGSDTALIAGAEGPSYTPPTGTAGIVYYFALVINTNDAIEDGVPGSLRSREAKVMTGIGTGSFVVAIWVNEDHSLISNMPANLSISREAEESLTVEAAAGLTGLQWSINGIDLAGARGTGQSISIEAANYGVGTYTLGLRAVKDTAPYSINITFSVVD